MLLFLTTNMAAVTSRANQQFRMVANYGEGFFYRGGSWHGKVSTRYRTHHIKKSMQFLESNMQE